MDLGSPRWDFESSPYAPRALPWADIGLARWAVSIDVIRESFATHFLFVGSHQIREGYSRHHQLGRLAVLGEKHLVGTNL